MLKLTMHQSTSTRSWTHLAKSSKSADLQLMSATESDTIIFINCGKSMAFHGCMSDWICIGFASKPPGPLLLTQYARTSSKEHLWEVFTLHFFQCGGGMVSWTDTWTLNLYGILSNPECDVNWLLLSCPTTNHRTGGLL